MKKISGYSKLSKEQKINWLVENYLNNDETAKSELISYWHRDLHTQKILDEFSENTISNYFFPFSVAPNFLINGEWYCLPMAIEESSVVAAMSNAAKYWSERGGFTTEILGTSKVGQVHFIYKGDEEQLKADFSTIKNQLLEGSKYISYNMEQRGGGVVDIELVDMTQHEAGYFQLKATFETCDSMGANFINTCLEEYASTLKELVGNNPKYGTVKIILAIVSNYTPNCIARATVSC
ncbi:MAG: hydroxymethylglutaryl-CoA reductase, partial [Chitinophagales bacterium]|nr:hydroxymethylglutaryl-CoA reductase [Chitinophagales bacterium]